jgi:hypothetical protein
MSKRGGTIAFKIDGVQYRAKGSFKYGLGKPTRESIIGADGPHGFKETHVAPFIEGEITDGSDLNDETLANVSDATITLELANGKVVALRNAFSCNPDGYSAETEEGNIGVRFEGTKAEVVR